MTRWHPARWPLRTRVALAFLAATAVALVALGVFVQVRVSDALEDRLRDTASAEADRLAAMSRPARSEELEALRGEVHAQLLTTQGDVQSSSHLVAAPMLGPAEVRAAYRTGPSWREVTVTVFDDDAASEGQRERERETLVLLVRPTDEGILLVGASREDVDEALAALRNQLLVAGPLALVLAGGLGYLVAGAGLRPIERMRARAATISSRSAGERLPVPAADDELRRLALTLNAMIERLDDGIQRERRFVAEASHDLRTPLALMLTEVELALARPRTADELTQALDSVHDEVRRLAALAEDLLERAGPDEGGVSIDARAVDLVALAHRVADRFVARAGDRTIRITGSTAAEIEGDAAHLDRALSNLVDNALRHGAGDIGIEIRGTDVGAAITVTDHGRGFARNPSSPSTQRGLGLRIVSEIARAHGGALEVQHADGLTTARVEISSPGH